MAKLLLSYLIGFCLLLAVAAATSTEYRLTQAEIDSTLSNSWSTGGHVFWIKDNFGGLFYNHQEWNWDQDSGRATIEGNFLIITGKILPRDAPDACQRYDVYLKFEKSDQSSMGPNLELKDSAYLGHGGYIDPSKWSYYRLVEGYWSGSGCNSKDRIQFTGTEDDMPLQLGEGANGKNGAKGISVWLSFGGIIVDINVDVSPITPPTEPPTNPPTYPPTQPPTKPPTQPPTYPPTQPPTNPPTYPPTHPPTYPPTQPPVLDCSTLECPDGYQCVMKDNVRKCVQVTQPPTNPPTPPPHGSCDKVQCPKGFKCIFDEKENVAKCVKDHHRNPCEKKKCPPHHYCKCDPSTHGKAKCVPFRRPHPSHRPEPTERPHRPHRPHPEPTRRPHPPIHNRPNKCTPRSCPRGEKCICIHNRIYCIPRTTCDKVRCPYGYHCETARDKRKTVFCVPDCPKISCENVGCPLHHRCKERYGKAVCVRVDPIPTWTPHPPTPTPTLPTIESSSEGKSFYGNYYRNGLADLGYNENEVGAAISQYEARNAVNNNNYYNNYNKHNNNNNDEYESVYYRGGQRGGNQLYQDEEFNQNNDDAFYDGIQIGYGDGGF